MEEEDSDEDFDYEQFLLAEQVRKYYYHGFYPLGILVIWTLLRADCYDLSGCDSLGNPPIVYASKCGSIILLRLLLHYNADINAMSKLRETALIVACRNKRMRAIKLLLRRGALTELVDRTGYSALRWAVIHERVDMVKLLLRYNASVTKDCYTAGSALDIAKRGTSEEHAAILKELEKKLVTEREALLLQIVEQKKQDAITEIDEYRKKRQGAKDSQTNAVTEPAIAPESQTISKPAKKSQRQTTRGKVLAGDSSRGRRRSVETSVGRRVPTPPTEQLAWQSPEESSEWIKVATGKWQTRKHLQDTGAPISAAEITMVEKFETVHQLLTSDGKWQTFLSHQMPLRASQAQLTIEDL